MKEEEREQVVEEIKHKIIDILWDEANRGRISKFAMGCIEIRIKLEIK